MSSKLLFEGDAELTPFSPPPKPRTGFQKPADIIDAPAPDPNTIWYLSIIKPHVDSHEILGPTKAFRHLLPRIEAIVSNSPSAIDKLEELKATEDVWGELEINEDFFINGFDIFVVEGQRNTYTVLKITREVDQEVYDVLPAPVYTVVSSGPLEHAPVPSKPRSSSASKSSPVMLSSKFTPGKPKGYAVTTQLHGSFVGRAAAKEIAKHVMTVLLLDEENVNETKRWEKGTKGGGILIAMNPTTMWEVKVLYADDPVGRAQTEMERQEEVFVL